ncbi:MAG: metallophosphoesterase family protein [Prevotella sp.]|nr:metallophosphoesterase family protein [Prevotella sp.]
MIARIVIPLILIIVLSDLYIDMHYFRKHYHVTWWQRLLWWVPCIGMVVYTCALASIRNFAPADLTWLNTYLFLLGMFVGPKAIFTVTSFLGWIVRKFITHTHRNWGHYVGILLGFLSFATYVYGLTIGFSEIRVKHVDLTFGNLPQSFDGYRIVHVSDLHIGTFDGWRKGILTAEMDSIRQQHADLICFTGDLQNMRPQEIVKFRSTLYNGMAGAVSVLGNHDYTEYVKENPQEKAANEKRLTDEEAQQLHWNVLRNQHIVIKAHGTETAQGTATKAGSSSDSIIICGTDNDGRPPFPNRSDYRKATRGIAGNAFVIMLQHDPSAWRRSVLPKTTAQLTLSGHTHAGQMQVLGWRPTQLRQQEDYGLYEQDGRYLYVTAGLGGFVPFRLNMPNEVTVITLHTKKHKERNNL